MSLPRLVLVTDRTQCARSLVEVMATAVAHGARAVVLRDKDLPAAERTALAADLRSVLQSVGGLLVHGGARGAPPGAPVHLAAAEPFPAVRPPLVGRSCHSAAELARAARERCDWVTLSPVFPTVSKPGYGPALGMEGLAALVPGAPPVLALGGIRPDHVAGCLAAGAHGIAVMGPVMRDPALVAEYVAAEAGAQRSRPDGE